MKLFGITITNKPQESDEELKALLKKERKQRAQDTLKAKRKAQALENELQAAKEAEAKRLKAQQDKNLKQALIHLEAAERYTESLELSEGARKSQMQAIVDRRVEMAESLGFPLKGTITKTIGYYRGN